jgi:hypothetical protein
MRSIGKTLLLTAALAQALAGCSDKPTDLHGLPDDDAERATLCSRAAVAFAGAARQLNLPADEQTRRSDLLQKVIDSTDYFGVTKQSEEAGKKSLADLESTVTGGQWLDTLNRCKAAYELGEAEKLPALPTDPKEKVAACGAASLIASLKGGKVADAGNLMQDPQSAYFVMLLAGENKGNMAAAAKAMTEQAAAVASGGAALSLKDQCLADYPKAKSGTAVSLPADEEQATLGCALAAALTQQGGGEAAKRGEAMQKKLNGVTLAVSFLRGNIETRAIDAFTSLGTAPDVLTACEKRFGG